uniref:histidine kinase n=1 Tax=Solibacter usitatus (strain Ellin6076) TaxID=234267 RepID=Q023H5_SOLUE
MSGISTILVVDDDSDSLRLLTDILTAEGYRVRPADSGQLALASAKAAAPELIMLDIRMPGMDGFEVCRRLQADEKTRRIPIIFLSAAGQLQDRVLGLSLGAADFISKPYERPELLARVRTHMELGRLRAHLEHQVAAQTAELRLANEQLSLELEERLRAEQELRESEARFRSLADRAPVGIWLTTLDNEVTFYNRRALAFLGRKAAERSGLSWAEFVHPEDMDAVKAKYQAAVSARRSFRIECRVRRWNGKYRWVLNTGIPRMIDGVCTGYITTSTDITDLKRRQEELLMHQKLESLGVLAGGVAHDFNNLLGSILAESDLAMSDLPEDTPGRDGVERIAAIAQRASEIVNLLMTYAGDRDLAIEGVDLSKVTSEVLFLMRPPLSETAVIELNLVKDLPLVQANKAQIRQVVMNLLTNAAEALKGRGGKITVSTGLVHIGKAAAAKRKLNLPVGEYCFLSVSDTGCGMSPQTKDKVFDPFYSTKFVGRGLGLAAVQGILRSHRGAISVVSEPERGSTFEVLLPRSGKRERHRRESMPEHDTPLVSTASGGSGTRGWH